jgi:hypothetical protein
MCNHHQCISQEHLYHLGILFDPSFPDNSFNFCFCFSLVLGIQLRALSMLSTHSTTELLFQLGDGQALCCFAP